MYAYNDTVLWSTFVIRERAHKQNKNIIHLLGRVCVWVSFVWALLGMLYNNLFVYEMKLHDDIREK